MVIPLQPIRPPFRPAAVPYDRLPGAQLAERLDWWLEGWDCDTRVTGIVTRVPDGDTLTVQTDVSILTIRLVGIDAPEIHSRTRHHQPGSHEAQTALARLALGMPVIVAPDSMQPSPDHFGRTVAHVIRQNDNLHLGLELIRQGWARPWPAYPCDLSPQYTVACNFAKTMRFGLWARPRTVD